MSLPDPVVIRSMAINVSVRPAENAALALLLLAPSLITVTVTAVSTCA
jgi:hypothetical protein